MTSLPFTLVDSTVTGPLEFYGARLPGERDPEAGRPPSFDPEMGPAA